MRARIRLWWRAVRPFSFTASVIPVLVGSLLGFDEQVRVLPFLLALVGSVAIHAGTNLVNDYYDHVKGADGPDSLGPSGVIQRGDLSPRAVLAGGIVCFAVGSAIGLLLVWMTSIELLWLGLASVAAGFLYTGAPVSLAYIGLGELTVFVFMGPVMVLGSYFVQTERWDWGPVIVSLPVAFLVTGILHANNMRDIEDDRRHGKRTIATLIGRRWANGRGCPVAGAGGARDRADGVEGGAPCGAYHQPTTPQLPARRYGSAAHALWPAARAWAGRGACGLTPLPFLSRGTRHPPRTSKIPPPQRAQAGAPVSRLDA
jgi:1,4-dihydroxy-2-naphthoate octaprenyltransferase